METQPTLAGLVANVLMLLLFAGSVTTWVFIWRRFADRGDILDYQPRLRVPWRGIDVLVIAAFYLSGMLIAPAVGLLMAGVNLKEVKPDDMLKMPDVLAMLSVSGVVTVVFIVVWLRAVRSATRDDLGWRRGYIETDVGWGIFALLAALVPVYAIQIPLFHFFPQPHKIAEAFEHGGDATAFAFATILTTVVAPVVEEHVFRMTLQGWLEAIEPRWRRRIPGLRRWPRGWAPIVIASMVFGAVHVGNGPAPVPLFFLALILGYLYQRTHRILPSIVTHVAFNATSMLMLMLARAGGA